MPNTGIVATLFLKFTKTSPEDERELRSDYEAITHDVYANMTILLSNVLSAERSLEPTKRILHHGPDDVAEMSIVFTPNGFGLPDRYTELEGEREAVDLVRKSDKMKAYLLAHDLQAVFQPLSTQAAIKSVQNQTGMGGLACFDMDSTLIQQEVIDLLAGSLGPEVEKEVSNITEQAMRGELDFQASLKERCKLLKGVPATIWQDLQQRITITPGAKDLIKALQQDGWKTAVLSGGFTPLALWLKKELDLDHAFANNLLVSEIDHTLTGDLDPGTPVVDAQAKGELMLSTAERYDIPRERILAVGDGANDLIMLNAAGLGLAFNAKEKVKKQAPASLDSSSLKDILFVLGHEEQA